MPVVEVVRDAVTSPGAAPHAQREIEAVVEATAITECMRLVDQDAHHIGTFGQYAAAARILRVQAHRMSSPLMREDFVRARNRGFEVFGAVNGENQRQLFA